MPTIKGLQAGISHSVAFEIAVGVVAVAEEELALAPVQFLASILHGDGVRAPVLAFGFTRADIEIFADLDARRIHASHAAAGQA